MHQAGDGGIVEYEQAIAFDGDDGEHTRHVANVTSNTSIRPPAEDLETTDEQPVNG
jgi:hypothetical protein